MSQHGLPQLAAQQLGLVTVRQIQDAGFSEKVARRRVEDGEWQRVHLGVYLLGASAPSLAQRELAAQLALGPRAVLSHQTAARQLGILVGQPDRVQVTIDADRRVAPLEGVDVWRSRHLTRQDVVWRRPFLYTDVARTVLDLSSVLDRSALGATVDACLRKSGENWQSVFTTLNEQGLGKAGALRLRGLLEEKRKQAELAASVMESFAMELGLATGRKPRMHHRLHEGKRCLAEFDLAWPEVKLGAEFDGWLFHCSWHAFNRDRTRDLQMFDRGWQTLRFTWKHVTEQRDWLIGVLQRAHARQATRQALARAAAQSRLLGAAEPAAPEA